MQELSVIGENRERVLQDMIDVHEHSVKGVEVLRFLCFRLFHTITRTSVEG